MNSVQRVFASVEGKPTDRRAFSAVLSLYGAGLTECPLEQYYTDANAYARGQAAVLETFLPDIIFSPFTCPAEGEAFGSRVRFFDKQPPNLVQPAITSADQIDNCPLPDIDTHPRLIYVRSSIQLMKAAFGDEVPIAGILLSPFDLPLMIMGIEGWLETILFDKDGMKRMLDVTTRFFLKWANCLLDEGASFLVMPAAFLNPSVVTRDIVEKKALPVLREAFADVNGPIVVHNVGSSTLAHLDLITGLPNVIGFAVDHSDSIDVVREKTGANAVLLSGPDAPSIGSVSPEDIETSCRLLLEDRREDPRFILSTSGPDVPLDTPAEHIHAIRRAVEAFGPGGSDE